MIEVSLIEPLQCKEVLRKDIKDKVEITLNSLSLNLDHTLLVHTFNSLSALNVLIK